MKNKNLGLGFFLIIIGLLWFLDNFGFLSFSLTYLISSFVNLWPLILVCIGITVIFNKNKKLEKLVWLLFFIIILGYSFYLQYNSDNTVQYTEEYKHHAFTDIMDENTKMGTLNLDIGATKFDISPLKDDLITLDSNISGLEYVSEINNELQIVSINNDSIDYEFMKGSDYYLNMGINEDIPWDIDLNCGAVDGNMYLDNIILNNLDLDMGAGKLNIIIGNKNENVNLDIDCGVSDISITVPEDCGLFIDYDGALNSTNIESLGLVKNSNKYTSEDFDTAITKINITVNMGLGKLNIIYD